MGKVVPFKKSETWTGFMPVYVDPKWRVIIQQDDIKNAIFGTMMIQAEIHLNAIHLFPEWEHVVEQDNIQKKVRMFEKGMWDN